MPTKLNSAGQQQNYIPQGNGDPSGEYGDNATGSNRHISIEKKDSEKIITNKQNNNSQDLNFTKKETVENDLSKPSIDTKTNIQKYILSHSKFNKEKMSFLIETIQNGDNQCNLVLNNSLKDRDYQFSTGPRSFYQDGANKLQLATKDIKSNSREEGETVYHELGHLIDMSKKSPLNSWRPLSCSYYSKIFGKTLKEMVQDEGKQFSNNKEQIDEIYDLKNKLEKDMFEQYGLTDQVFKERKQISETINNGLDLAVEKTNKDIDKIISEIMSERDARIRDEKGDIYKELLSKREEIQNQFVLEHKSEYDRAKQIDELKYKAQMQAHDNFSFKYSSLSDMYNAATQGRATLNGFGHTASYWRNNSDNQAIEFFAEAYSSKAIKSSSYDIIKKYFPKSIEIFEEILKEQS